MNQFAQYEQLLALKAVANQYHAGQACAGEIQQLSEQLTSRQYRVAVIGEFKRGKSSLVNAIIGAEVLPTDILPLTAAITRVTYGNTRGIHIRYKDGSSEEKTVNELIDYATKYDEHSAALAATVQEIEVTYPSVFCQNRIDILDTPGLNDNEHMTEVTLSILGEVDAAIVVLSANMPISMTEKQLILDLIAQRQIRHLIFVLTHIDTVSRRTSEQDRSIRFSRERISTEVLAMALERFADQPYYLEKAKQILSAPDLFAVSSVQAIDGFIHDDIELLEKSRFPFFKNELLALLTAAQSMDIETRIRELAEQVASQADTWYHSDISETEQQIADVKDRINRLNEFNLNAPDSLTQMLLNTDALLADQELLPSFGYPQLRETLLRHFITELSGIRESTNTDGAIRQALKTAGAQANAAMRAYGKATLKAILLLLMQQDAVIVEEWNAVGLSADSLSADLTAWYQKGKKTLFWPGLPFSDEEDLKGVDVILPIGDAIDQALAVFDNETAQMIAQWRQILLSATNAACSDTRPMEKLEQELTAAEQLLIYQKQNHQINLQKIQSWS